MGVDATRFTELYQELYPRVLAYALCRARPPDACDAVAETFQIAWRKRESLPAAVLPWLLVTARNVLANQSRRYGREVLTDEINQLSAQPADAEVVERLTLLSALAELTGKEREALMLAVWDGLSARDAAKVAGCTTIAYSVRLHRARNRFAAAVEARERQAQSDTVALGRGNGER